MPSTVIKYYKYVPSLHRLIITFVSGISYQYFNVTERMFENFRRSSSKGAFFNRYIKPGHLFEKL